MLNAKRTKLRVYKNPACCFLFTVYFLLFTVCSCSSQKERIFQKSMVLMDTTVTITIVSDSKDDAEKAINAAFSRIKNIESLSDFYSSYSEISLMNKNAGGRHVKVSPDILELLNKALYVSEKTAGAFDVTIGPVVKLYDFIKKTTPEKSAINTNLQLVNYRDVIVDRDKSTVLLKKKAMFVDLGGIAKGFAADKAVAILKKQGIHSGLVSVAGDIKAFGLKPDGRPWKIGIRHPRATDKNDDIMATIDLNDMAISTSGDYERYFIMNNKRYHHLLDPNTGYPAQECQSVSIIAKEGTFTDAFATGIFILGPEKGMKVLKEMGYDGIIVDSQGKIHITPAIRGKIEFKRTF
jgi:FAD:protein FMN transferase